MATFTRERLEEIRKDYKGMSEVDFVEELQEWNERYLDELELSLVASIFSENP